jgi:hypothetical protein
MILAREFQLSRDALARTLASLITSVTSNLVLRCQFHA